MGFRRITYHLDRPGELSTFFMYHLSVSLCHIYTYTHTLSFLHLSSCVVAIFAYPSVCLIVHLPCYARHLEQIYRPSRGQQVPVPRAAEQRQHDQLGTRGGLRLGLRLGQPLVCVGGPVSKASLPVCELLPPPSLASSLSPFSTTPHYVMLLLHICYMWHTWYTRCG